METFGVPMGNTGYRLFAAEKGEPESLVNQLQARLCLERLGIGNDKILFVSGGRQINYSLQRRGHSEELFNFRLPQVKSNTLPSVLLRMVNLRFLLERLFRAKYSRGEIVLICPAEIGRNQNQPQKQTCQMI